MKCSMIQQEKVALQDRFYWYEMFYDTTRKSGLTRQVLLIWNVLWYNKKKWPYKTGSIDMKCSMIQQEKVALQDRFYWYEMFYDTTRKSGLTRQVLLIWNVLWYNKKKWPYKTGSIDMKCSMIQQEKVALQDRFYWYEMFYDTTRKSGLTRQVLLIWNVLWYNKKKWPYKTGSIDMKCSMIQQEKVALQDRFYWYEMFYDTTRKSGLTRQVLLIWNVLWYNKKKWPYKTGSIDMKCSMIQQEKVALQDRFYWYEMFYDTTRKSGLTRQILLIWNVLWYNKKKWPYKTGSIDMKCSMIQQEKVALQDRFYWYEMFYDTTRKSGFTRQVLLIWNVLWYNKKKWPYKTGSIDMKCSMIQQEKNDLLIQVTAL